MGFRMHFASCESDGAVRRERWHRMAFKKDFVETLRVYGRLPFASIHDQLDRGRQLEAEARGLKAVD